MIHCVTGCRKSAVLLSALFIVTAFVMPSLKALELPLREVVRVSSFRENQLVGYGVVVGLPRSGDSRSPMGKEALRKILKYRGINLPESQLNSKNIAAVMVMAKIPPHGRVGDVIDIWVSSVGDASSLKGGYLMQTPLTAPDGEIYAVAQSSLAAVNSDSDERGRAFNAKRMNTVHVPGGAVMEKTITQPLAFKDRQSDKRYIRLSLLNYSVNTAENIVAAINTAYQNSAAINNDGTIQVTIPDNMRPTAFLSKIYDLEIEVKNRAKVVVDPRSGTVVMGGNVALSEVSVTKGGITIEINDNDTASLREKEVSTMYLKEAPTVSDLVQAMNKMGLPAEDIIDIIKVLHAAGALHAELEIL